MQSLIPVHLANVKCRLFIDCSLAEKLNVECSFIAALATSVSYFLKAAWLLLCAIMLGLKEDMEVFQK